MYQTLTGAGDTVPKTDRLLWSHELTFWLGITRQHKNREDPFREWETATRKEIGAMWETASGHQGPSL